MTFRCKGCQGEFTAPAANAVWCSEKCRDRWKYHNQPWYKPRTKPAKVCAKCGTAFTSSWGHARLCDTCRRPSAEPQPCRGGCGQTLQAGRVKFCADCKPFLGVVREYRITVPEYRRLVAECGGKCAICRGTNGKRRLAVDHCHKTGDARGLLCFKCNAGLGMLGDSPALMRRAVAYVEQRSMRFSKPSS